MKNLKFLLAAILLAIAVATPIPHVYSSSLSITVFMDKPSYTAEESITVFGNLTYNGSPVQDWPVALEVQDSYHTPVVTRTLQTDTNGTYSLVFKLPSNAKLGIYTAYVSSSYKGETATSSTKFKLIQIAQITVIMEGNDYTITIESNATITNVTASNITLHFTSSGPTGEKAYVNATFPVGLNKTEIKVSIDNTTLVPPPYPIITANGTHYFVYFEFALSAHNIIIQYATRDVATTNVTPVKTVVGQGYNVLINATIENQGYNEETFNVTVYANLTFIESQAIILAGQSSTIVQFTWNTTGFARGKYEISAAADTLPSEEDIDDNNCTDGWVLITRVGDLGSGPPPQFFKFDGKVDSSDLALFIRCYKGTASSEAMHLADLGSGPPPQFFKPDGKVDSSDLALFIKCYKGLGP